MINNIYETRLSVFVFSRREINNPTPNKLLKNEKLDCKIKDN
jgi:hypothetical protein